MSEILGFYLIAKMAVFAEKNSLILKIQVGETLYPYFVAAFSKPGNIYENNIDTNIPDELIINRVPIKSLNSDSMLFELHKIFLSSK